jgi:N6-L-threonylcarbamoyladenine synthase
MLILGIETSCDETGVALYDTEKGLLAQKLHSQIDMHRAYGGVVPELASRDHISRLLPLTRDVLRDAGRTVDQIDRIAYTQGPGLGGALLVGTSVAAGLGAALGKPLMGIHHLEGHLLSPLLAETRPAFPFIALLVSGGHTQLMRVQEVGQYELLGETLDDAAGEAFDKTAMLLGLGYPGGPALSRLAADGNPRRFNLPRPMLKSGGLDFSFSGLKTAVLTLVNQFDPMQVPRADIAAAFQSAIVDVLVAKSLAALDATGLKALVVAGGVGANQRLRDELEELTRQRKATVHFPPLALCTDNGAMIAFAAAMRLDAGLPADNPENGAFGIRPRWDLNLYGKGAAG